MKINWKIRTVNWKFWVAIGAVILSASGIKPETLTSWALVGQAFMGIITNPFVLITTLIAVGGVITDPTTPGLSDSDRALAYTAPGVTPAADTPTDTPTDTK